MTQEQDFHCVADQLQLLMYPRNVRGQTRGQTRSTIEIKRVGI